MVRCPVSGHIYNAGAGYFNRAAIVTGPTTTFGDGATPEEVVERWKEVAALDGAEEISDAMAAVQMILAAFEAKKKPAKAAKGEGGSRL